MRALAILVVLGLLATSATAEPRWTKDPLGFSYQARAGMARHAGVPKSRVVIFAAPTPRDVDDSVAVREARFVVALQDPDDEKIVFGADPDWVSVAARTYSEVRGGKLVPHVRGAEPCEDGDTTATCFAGRAEYLRFARDGWETAGAMYAIVRERGSKRFLIVGYAEKRAGEPDYEAAGERAKQLAVSVRL